MTFALTRLLALAVLAIAPALHAQEEASPVPAPESAGPEVAQMWVEGQWCGSGLLRGTALNLTQHQHWFEGTLVRGERTRQVDGRIEGTTLRTSRASAGSAGELVLRLEGDRLRIVAAGGPLTLARGMSFFRATGPGC
jgi:hypothetical protein